MTTENSITEFQQMFSDLEAEIADVIVGQKEIIRGTLSTILVGGHVLLEGVPGLGKTLLVNSIADCLGLGFKRIQFTPDLMPSDITGTEVLNENEDGHKSFEFVEGPLFSNIVLADEINRATPKTQSALLEAMAEKQVTVVGKTYKLASPFFVLATQNPVELEGTYPLPEAQLDRFMVKLNLLPPDERELAEILQRTTGTQKQTISQVIADPEQKIAKMQQLIREVVVARPVLDVLVRMISALNPDSKHASKEVKEYLRYGPGPRGAQSVILLAKVSAVIAGRMNVDLKDLQAAMPACLRHRLVLNFQAEAAGITSDAMIADVITAE